MKRKLQQVVGLMVERVEVHPSYHGDDHAFTLVFTDGTHLHVSSRCYNDSSSDVTVEVL